MLRPVYLIHAAILAAVAAVPLMDAAPAMDSVSQASKPLGIATHTMSPPAQTISSRVASATATPQRWVF